MFPLDMQNYYFNTMLLYHVKMFMRWKTTWRNSTWREFARARLHVTPVALSYDSSMTWWTVDVAQWYDTSRLYRMYCKPEWSGKLLTFSMVWTVLPPTTSVDPSKESGLPDTEVTYLTDSSWSDYTCFWSFTSRAKRSHIQVKTARTDMSLFSLWMQRSQCNSF